MKQFLIACGILVTIVISVFVFDVGGWLESQNQVNIRDEEPPIVEESPAVDTIDDSEYVEGLKEKVNDGVKSVKDNTGINKDTEVDYENDETQGTEETDDKTENSKKGDLQEVEWVGTSDGDTIKVTIGKKTETIRLLLIDTPESVHVEKPTQVYGLQASRYVKKLQKENRNVVMEIGNPQRDKYDRLLAYVYLEDGTMLNELLVREGYARVGYIYPPNTKYLDVLESAQEVAENERKRIWSIEGYTTENGFNMDVVTDKDLMKANE